jgi:hypothetical protein
MEQVDPNEMGLGTVASDQSRLSFSDPSLSKEFQIGNLFEGPHHVRENAR